MAEMSKLKSECHGADVILVDQYHDYGSYPVDVVYICSKCHKPCKVKEERDAKK